MSQRWLQSDVEVQCDQIRLDRVGDRQADDVLGDGSHIIFVQELRRRSDLVIGEAPH